LFLLKNLATSANCKIDNENCSCELLKDKIIISLTCVEKNDNEFLQNLTQIKANYIFTEMLELTLENKLFKNISKPSVRDLFSNKLVSLSIKNCQVQSINKGLFNVMPLLKKVSLNNNEIDSIEINSFLFDLNFESNILELYLSANKLDKIKRGQFNGLANLEQLFIDQNQIEEIELNSFESLNNLKQLNIQSNRIKVIQDKLLGDKTKLETLNLYQNNIENIGAISLNTLHSLKTLYLFSNKIKSIAFGNFIHLLSLKELKLDKNEIGSFAAYTFVGLEKLDFLDLSANKIKRLVNKAFEGLKVLTHLKLELNDINQIESDVFVGIANLTHLTLDSNQIFTLKNVQFNENLVGLSVRFNFISNLSEIFSPSLKSLYLSSNRIQEINFVSHLPNLERLDLSQNRLISLNDKSFSQLNKLKYLNLSWNKLDFESNLSYFGGQNNLEQLDISFNQIKYLNTNKTFQYLASLKSLNVSNNKLNTLNAFLFGYLTQLNVLNLASNNLYSLNEGCFLNFSQLKMLKLSDNQLNGLRFLRENRNFTKSLQSLELDYNSISFIGANDFEFNKELKFLNLNSNPIKSIHVNTFEKMAFLISLKLSNTSINELFINITSLKELDLSYTANLTLVKVENVQRIESVNLASTKMNISFGNFLSNLTRYVDFSFNSYTWTQFRMFNVLGNALETLRLRQTNLQNMEQISFENFLNLKYLDLSFNSLSSVSENKMEFLKNLEHLDLSSNRIFEFHAVLLNNLRYLNLENNQIFTMSPTLFDFYTIETLKMANNRLDTYPSFEMSEIYSKNAETFLELHLEHNQINEIRYFSFMFGKLKWANFESNNIDSIEPDAFLNCRSLEYLSLANNRLAKVEENNFHFLYSLIQLNLSSNEIVFIENSSFKNLNKLKSLDLNYNSLLSIQNDFFAGLTNLNDLYLMSKQNEIYFEKDSFKHLPNVSTIYIDESLIVKYKCLFMHKMDRDVQRNVSNRYTFYRSINFVSLGFSFNSANLQARCSLVFYLFQYKIHLNLKTDYENDLFYDSCQKVLIKRENNYNHTYKKCFEAFVFKDKEEAENSVLMHLILMMFSNFHFLLTMALIFCLIGPVFCLILRYELFASLITCLCGGSLPYEVELLKEIDLEIVRKRENIKKLNMEREQNEDDLVYLEKKQRKLKPVSTNVPISSELVVSDYDEKKEKFKLDAPISKISSLNLEK
jgi:Leucine-rich repeat (LRR) protein